MGEGWRVPVGTGYFGREREVNSEDIHRFLEGFQPGLQHIESYQLTAIPEYNFWVIESIHRSCWFWLD